MIHDTELEGQSVTYDQCEGVDSGEDEENIGPGQLLSKPEETGVKPETDE